MCGIAGIVDEFHSLENQYDIFKKMIQRGETHFVMHGVLPILSTYFFLFQIPFISLYFRHFQGVSALRFASALATRERGKREKKKESLAYSIAFSYCQSTLP